MTENSSISSPSFSMAAVAQQAQDAVGWCDSHSPDEVIVAVLQLARVVTELASEVDRLRSAVDGG